MSNSWNILVNKKMWLLNVLVDKLVWLIPKKSNLWIFGAWHGDKYADNSKYMYEYIRKTHKEIDAYWITKDYNLYIELSKNDEHILYYKSKQARLIRLRAQVVFYTNSLYDLGDFMLHSRGYCVSLWHGVLMKKVYLSDNHYLNKGLIYRLASCLKKHLFWEIKRNLTTITSYKVMNYYIECFGIKAKNIVVTGQPRNDVFLLQNQKSVQSKSKIILFMPTYRSTDKSNRVLYELFEEIINNEILNDFLEKCNYRFLIKCHYLQKKPEIKKSNNVIFLEDNEIDDVQQLLNDTDVMVTDFSSCYIDYSLLSRPILFLAKDKEQYQENDNGTFFDMFDFASDVFFDNVEKFTEALIDIENGNAFWQSSQKKINNFFNDEIKPLTSFSENVYQEVIKRISIKSTSENQ